MALLNLAGGKAYLFVEYQELAAFMELGRTGATAWKLEGSNVALEGTSRFFARNWRATGQKFEIGPQTYWRDPDHTIDDELKALP